MASTARATVPWAVNITTGILGLSPREESEQFEAAHFRHLNIDQDDIVEPCFDAQQGVVAVAGCVYLVPYRIEQRGKIIANVAFIVDDENANL